MKKIKDKKEDQLLFDEFSIVGNYEDDCDTEFFFNAQSEVVLRDIKQ